jgi:hypothetical protein
MLNNSVSNNQDRNLNEMSENQFELESQLHEQYAINNNANVGSFVTFLVALLALFGFFGYSFVYSSNEYSLNGKLIKDGIMSLDVFLLFSIIVIGMLFFLSLISLQLGFSSRSNQIIIDRIRDRYFEKNKQIIFGNSYSPKGKTWSSFIQDYFNMFYWLFFCGQVLMILFSSLKISQNISTEQELNWLWLIFTVIVFLIQISAIFFSIYCRSWYFVKYCTAFEKAIAEKMIKESCCIVRCIYKHKLSKKHKN